MSKEPAMIGGLVSAILLLAVSFGLNLTAEQIGLIGTVVLGVLSLFVRSQVTPVVKLTDAGINPVTLQKGPTTDTTPEGE